MFEHMGDEDLRRKTPLRLAEQLELSLGSTNLTYRIPHLITGPGSWWGSTDHLKAW
jgi:hypothetical protein